ncbi:MAG: hypothetical protein ACREEP_06205 [Dongiaceae bacterium]
MVESSAIHFDLGQSRNYPPPIDQEIHDRPPAGKTDIVVIVDNDAIQYNIVTPDLPPVKWPIGYHRMAIEEEARDTQETAFGRGDHRQTA